MLLSAVSSKTVAEHLVLNKAHYLVKLRGLCDTEVMD